MKKAIPYLTRNVKKVINNNPSSLSSKGDRNKVKKQIQLKQLNFFSQIEKQDNLDIV